ncbi:MAG: hypothetical protein K2P17_01685 [Helicobacteraceae bacterium]|nr:hypothetical protein [Helicobacteraceae bacterium]
MAFQYSEQSTIDRIIYKANITGYVYVIPIFICLIGLYLILISYYPVGFIILSLGILYVIKQWLYTLTTELYITNKLVVAKYGLIQRDTYL